jgi:DNA-nicking Smr family endonuclease
MKPTVKDFAALGSLRDALKAEAEAREKARREAERRAEEARRAANAFRTAMDELGAVQPLTASGRVDRPPTPAEPVPAQRLLDDQAVLVESISDEFGVEQLLETDENLSYRRPGLGSDVLKKLRRGVWVVQAELDLHGSRVEEARELLTLFLHDCTRHGLRCVRIVHGKGLNSKDKEPVLKGKVRSWLVQRDAVLAFVQARPAEGGAGALVVLLKAATP